MSQLAIVIPYYKMDFFEETLQSIAAQSKKDFVLYIGNDASPVDPLPTIQKYFKDSDLKYFDYSENLGGQNLALQWQRILENVTEDWFLILGDDDYLSDNYVEEFYASISIVERYNINVIKSRSLIIDENKKVKFDYFADEKSGMKPAPDFFLRKLEGTSNSSLSEHIFRLQKYREVGFRTYPMAWHSDDMAVLSFSDYENLYFIDSAICYVREFSNSISGGNQYYQEKKLATLYFFKDIVASADQRFNKKHIIDFLRIVENNTKNLNQKNADLFILKHYLKNHYYKQAIKFLKRIISRSLRIN